MLKYSRGLTVIELMIGLVILTLFLVMGTPSFVSWTQNSHIRNSAESIQNGLIVARTEAVRRNARVSFQLVTSATSSCAVATTGTNWIVSREDPTSKCDRSPSESTSPMLIQKRTGNEGSANAIITADQATITFNGLGRVTNIASSPATINVSNVVGGACTSASGPMRCLRVEVTNAGQIRMCDPSLDSGDARAC